MKKPEFLMINWAIPSCLRGRNGFPSSCHGLFGRRGSASHGLVRLLIGCAVTTSLWIQADARAADIYYYKMPSGDHLISDQPMEIPGAQLIRTRSISTLLQKKKKSARGGAAYKTSSGFHPSRGKSDYDDLIRKMAHRYHLDPAMIKAIMHAESAFKEDAVSLAGAQGLMQLMPATAERYGVDDPFDPGQSIPGAARYLKDLQTLFPDNIEFVLAAYNAGENAVMKYNGIPPYAETQSYVSKVIKLKRYYDLVQSP